jgi:N-acetylglucosamine-6-sulfatase
MLPKQTKQMVVLSVKPSSSNSANPNSLILPGGTILSNPVRKLLTDNWIAQLTPMKSLKRTLACMLAITWLLSACRITNQLPEPGITASPEPSNAPMITPQPPTAEAPDSYLPLLAKQPTSTPTPSPESLRPNILLIISDDQRYDTMEVMPRTNAWIFDQGVTFSRAYVTTAKCCPSRSSILTGMLAHNHGVLVNANPLSHTTFAQRFHESGYYTGLVGKYLNSWDGSKRPEFDFWVALQGENSPYYDPQLYVQGKLTQESGYITSILGEHARTFLQTAHNQEKPFLLIFAPNAPHAPALAAPGDEDLFGDLDPYRPASFGEEDISDKPDWVHDYPLLTKNEIGEIERFRQKQLQTLHALDLTIDNLMTELSATGELDNTVVLYLSDNGYFWGEHRISTEKDWAYEEGIHVPFALRYPPLTANPYVSDQLVANIDIAPTFYELAGMPIPDEVDGRSLFPLLEGEQEWRDKLLIENWRQREPYLAVRTQQYMYVEYAFDTTELYDMVADPYQLNNVAKNPDYAEVVAKLHEYLDEVRADLPERVAARWQD